MKWAYVLIALSLAACSSEWGAAEERFAQTYAEILVARELYPDTTAGNARVRAILRQYGYDGETAFRQHFLMLTRDPIRLRRIMDSATARAQRMLADSLRAHPR